MDPDQLRNAARARYERGRAGWALTRAWPALGTAVLVLLAGAPVWTALVWAGLATAFITMGYWQRTAWGEGAAAGMLFTLVPLGAAIWMRCSHGLVSMQVCHQVCSAVGIGGGALWGLWVAGRATTLGRGGLLWAGTGAALGAGVGCVALAVGSISGVIIGLVGGYAVVAGRQLLRA